MPLLPESFLTDTNGSLVHPLLPLTSDNCSLTQDHPFVCSKAQSSSPIAALVLQWALALVSSLTTTANK